MTESGIQKLIAAAIAVRRHAYAPYSHFSVGAAAVSEDGRIFTGCNVENASYPAGLCAEQSAVAAAVAGGAVSLQAVAVAGDGSAYTAPCGICRQVLREFGVPLVICARSETDYIIIQGDELLPHAFGAERLKQP